MKWGIILSVAVLLIAVSSSQIIAQERQVPLDKEGKILVITWQDEQRLHVFSDVPRFSEVRLFQSPDARFVLEITVEQEGVQSRERRTLSDIEVESLRARVTRALEEKAPQMGLDQSGRPTFLTMSFINSIVFYGPALTVVLQPSDVASGAMSYLVGGLGGFFIPYVSTKNSPLSSGQASLARIGFVQGAVHMPALFTLFRGTENWSEVDTRACLFSSVVGGVGGTLAGLSIAGKNGFTEGRSEVIGSFWTDAILIGSGTAYVAGLYDLDLDARSSLALQLALSGAGMYAASELSTMQTFTAGDARVMAVPSYLGAGFAASLLPFMDLGPKETVGALVAGYSAGCLAGWYVVKDRDYPLSNATYTVLGTLGGALVGGAIGIAIDNPKYLALMMDLGGIAGYAIMASSDEAATRARPSRSFLDDVKADIDLHPVGILQAAGRTTSTSFVQPFMTASLRW